MVSNVFANFMAVTSQMMLLDKPIAPFPQLLLPVAQALGIQRMQGQPQTFNLSNI